MEQKNPEQPKAPEVSQGEQKPVSPWQAKKESWYDKVPLNLKQLDIIIG